jgi:hypothetical protein
MTPDELLKQRYKVIADYPFSPYKVGEIISIHDEIKNLPVAETSHYVHFQPVSIFAEMLHLFKPLAWWEERQEHEIPSFLKDTAPDGEMFKVMSVEGAKVLVYNEVKPRRWTLLKYFLPGTEAEYNAYLNKQ